MANRHFLALKPSFTHMGRGGKMAYQGPIMQIALKFHLDSTQPNFKIAFMDRLPPERGKFWVWKPNLLLGFWLGSRGFPKFPKVG